MRVIRELLVQDCRVTIFAWNNRYIIKMERGPYEQTFKVDQFDIVDEAEVIALLDAEFVQQALDRFTGMGQSLHEAKNRTLD